MVIFSEFSVMFKFCSDSVPTCSEFSTMFGLCSEFIAHDLVYSDIIDFAA
jgi:hypothetical protein